MNQKFASLAIVFAALLLIGCAEKEASQFDLRQLTRVDIQETTPNRENSIVIMEKENIAIVKEAFQKVDWQPGTMVDIQGERTAEATFFYTFDENMPERLSAYEVYVMKNGSISFQSERQEEGYGELTEEEAGKIKTLFFQN